VAPQCTDRPASLTVYCSCRCANFDGKTDDGAPYCTCGSGYECVPLVPAVVPNDPRTGAYCIKAHTTYNRATACVTTCDPADVKCSVPDAGPLPGPPDGGAAPSFINVIRAENGLCFPGPLPTDAAGLARCRIFEALAPGDGCAGHPGLTPADETTAKAVRDAGSIQAQRAVCLLAQLGGSCTASPDPGWCYVQGPAAPSGCAQSIAFSKSGMPPAGVTTLVACP
jgi:hypothetical protein